jgi:formimidoylglutamate deiminase
MLEAGYTSVIEFHYLHSDPVNDDDAMFAALQSAAAEAGIRLIYVPVFYERAGLGRPEPEEQQGRFVLQLDAFLEHQARCREKAAAGTTVAIGAHSLRAVHADSLHTIAYAAREQNIPMHLHIAEQLAEVEQCIAATGMRPVEWLLENESVDERWCLVHATHMNAAETEALAKSNAVVCICPTTEANLGDGIFPLQPFLAHGGRIAIGSDSQVSINPFEELRWLEYGQRLSLHARNIAAIDDAHVGRELFGRTLAGGAQAAAQTAGLAQGAVADLVTLRADDPMLAGHSDETLLDALVFSGYRSPVERVMVRGEWQVVAGDHVARAETRERFAGVLRTLQ